MHKIEVLEILRDSIPKLRLENTLQGQNTVLVVNFSRLFKAIQRLDQLNYLKKYTATLLLSDVLTRNNAFPEISVSKGEFQKISREVDDLRNASEILFDILAKTTEFSENSVAIKLPPVKSFEELSKVSNDFKIAIELPVHEASEEVRIEKVEEGSIWITIVGSTAALTLIARVVTAALNVAKINAQLKWHDEQSRTIGLKNDLIESILNTQKNFIKGKLEEETRSFLDSDVSPDAFNRFKMSVEMMADLIDRGAEIKPGLIKDEELKKSFPDFTKQNLLGGVMKKIGN